MAVVNLLDRIEADMKAVWQMCAEPDDAIEYAASLQIVEMTDEEGEEAKEVALTIYVSLACPEVGTQTATNATLVVPMKLIMAGVEPLAINIWERLTASRMIYGAGLHDAAKESPTD